MIRLFLCLFVIIFFPLRVNAMEYRRDEDQKSERDSDYTSKNSELAEDLAAKNRAASHAYLGLTDDDDNFSSPNSSQENSDSGSSYSMLDIFEQLVSAKEAARELREDRLDVSQVFDDGDVMDAEEEKAIKEEIQGIYNEWHDNSMAYRMMKAEVEDGLDSEDEEARDRRELELEAQDLQELIDAAEAVVKEAECSFSFLFPNETTRSLALEKEIGGASLHKISFSTALNVAREEISPRSDFSSMSNLEEEKPKIMHPFMALFFKAKGEIAILTSKLKEREQLYQEAVKSLATQKKERKSALRTFRRKNWYKLCKSSAPIIEDYHPRIRQARDNVEQHALEHKKMSEIMAARRDDSFYFAQEIVKDISQKNLSQENDLQEDFLASYNQALRNTRDYFLKRYFLFSDADRNKITYEELMLEK